MAKRKTNTQAIARLMDYSNHGALMQAFILEAIRRYAEQCEKAGADHFESPLLCGAAWVGCATEARTTLEAHLKG